MRTASAAVIALLASRQFYLAELYTITLVGGTVLRYSGAATDIVYAGNTWQRTGLQFTRGATKTTIGLETDTFRLSIAHDPNDASCNIGGLKFPDFVRQGGLDGAIIQQDRAFMSTWGDTSGGLVTWFYGKVSDCVPGRAVTEMDVKDVTERLNAQWPPHVYQASCRHTLYDAGCTLSKAAFAVAGTVAAGSTTTAINSNLTQASDYFALGFLTFTSGANNGQVRSVKSYANSGGVLTLNFPLPTAPANGDTFTVYPGCDKLLTTCTNKYANAVNFGGQPFVPAPETAR